jgi:gallate decarboxylase subunit D
LNRFGIAVYRHQMGRDTAFLITGGEAHIGAVSTAFYTLEGAVTVQTATVPGHKEDVLTQPLAIRAASNLNCTVTVAAGIHIDQASKEDIQEIVDIVDELFNELLEKK